MAQIGLKNFYYAIMTTEDTATTAPVYGKPKLIPGINAIDINPNISKSSLSGDDAIIATHYSFGEVEVTIDIACLTLEEKAVLLGHTVSEDGIIISKGSDSAPYVAIMFESETHDGKIRYVKLLKGKFSETQVQTNTRGENIDYQLDSLSGTFVCRMNDSAWKKEMETTITSVASTWYSSVEAEAA